MNEQDTIRALDAHLDEIPEKHTKGFLKLTSVGKNPNLVRAAIEYVSSNETEETLCDDYDVEPQELIDTSFDVLEHTDVDSGLDDLADWDLFQYVFELDYDERRRMAEVANTEQINGRSNQMEIATWYANNYNQEVVKMLCELIE